MSETKVENVKDFLDKLTEIQKNKHVNTELFFRGHADKVYVAEPTIFRKNGNGERNLLKNEKNLFNDIITQCPEDFKDCQYTFEYLVKMQHYGLPTRLLDITSNALVALYFACCSLNSENNAKDGQVLVYVVRKDSIKNYNSDTVSVLSNLAQLNNDFELFTKNQLEYVQENKKLLEYMEKAINIFKFLQEEKELSQKINIRNGKLYDTQLSECKESLKELIDLDECNKIDSSWFWKKEGLDCNEKKYKHNVITIDEEEELIRPYLDKLKSFIKLIQSKERFLHFIKQEKSYFDDKIDDKKDVQKIICVQAKLNNQRIIRQNGLFFLFGMGKTKADPIKFSDYIKFEYTKRIQEEREPSIQEITNPTIIISAEKKKDILKELRTLGISEETLMPEIDNVARTLKDRYN